MHKLNIIYFSIYIWNNRIKNDSFNCKQKKGAAL